MDAVLAIQRIIPSHSVSQAISILRMLVALNISPDDVVSGRVRSGLIMDLNKALNDE